MAVRERMTSIQTQIFNEAGILAVVLGTVQCVNDDVADLLSLFIGNGNVEGFFDLQYNFYTIKPHNIDLIMQAP